MIEAVLRAESSIRTFTRLRGNHLSRHDFRDSMCCLTERPRPLDPQIHRWSGLFRTAIQRRRDIGRYRRRRIAYNDVTALHDLWIRRSSHGTYYRWILGGECEIRLEMVLLGNGDLERYSIHLGLSVHARDAWNGTTEDEGGEIQEIDRGERVESEGRR